MDIANGNSSNWSYPSWPSHLDHILITNELFDELQHNSTVIETIKVDDYVGGWSSYDTNISDHRPVAMKFTPSTTLSVDDISVSSMQLKNYPNPFRTKTTLTFKGIQGEKELHIYDMLGRRIVKASIATNLYTWNSKNYPRGIYIAKLISNNAVQKHIKLIKN